MIPAGQLAENAEQHGNSHGSFAQPLSRTRTAAPQLLCENVYQMVKRPFRVVPAFPGTIRWGRFTSRTDVA